MKPLLLLLTAFFSFAQFSNAQSFLTKNGKISFFSKTSMENIDAVNNEAVSILNSKTGELAFSVLINGFLFKKALMQEHFNENYMESTKYPKATFSGKIDDLSKIDFGKDGTYNVSVTGNLMMHNANNKITAPAIINVKGKKINANSTFIVVLADYKISIPKLVEDNISKTIEIKIDCKYNPK